MSVVIVGGHDRMVRQYKEICEDHQWKAKVFTQMRTGLDKQIGCPDLLIDEARTSVVRCHTSSKSALTEILENHSV